MELRLLTKFPLIIIGAVAPILKPDRIFTYTREYPLIISFFFKNFANLLHFEKQNFTLLSSQVCAEAGNNQ